MSLWVEIEAVRGDNLNLRFDYVNEDGSAYDLTGYAAYLTIKKRIDDGNDDNAVLQKKLDPIMAPANGIITFSLTSAELNDLSGIYYFDHQIVLKSSGNAITPYLGKIEFIRDVTRELS